MLSKRIFDSNTDFKTLLGDELKKKGMSIKELADRSGIPAATIYKITSGERDPRFSTVKRIIRVLDPKKEDFIAIIGAKFLLHELRTPEIEIGSKNYKIKECPITSIEECVISTVRAEKDGASGIICAPVLASMIEKAVDIPVVIMRPKEDVLKDAISSLVKKIA